MRMQRFSRYIQLEGLVDMNLAEVGRGSYVVRAIGQVLNFKANVSVNNCLFTLESFQLLFAVLYRRWVLHSNFREIPRLARDKSDANRRTHHTVSSIFSVASRLMILALPRTIDRSYAVWGGP